MDDILDTCFDENLFKTLLCHSKCTKETKIESRNPYAYVNKLEPIYETHKGPKDEISALECRATHKVAPRDIEVSENNLLFHYFAKLGSQNKDFIRTWLYLFVRMQRHFFTSMATICFKHKGLTMDSWLDSIIDGCKGDVLTLLGLSMLVEKHVLVHLKGGNIWSSLKTIPPKHPDALKQIDLHLVYVGRGNFIQLQVHSILLQMLPTMSSDTTTVLVGTMLCLSPEEYKTLDKLIMSGLGIGLNRETKFKGLPIKQLLHTASKPDAGIPSTDSQEPHSKQSVHTATKPDNLFLCTGADWQILQNADLVTLLGHFTHGKTRKTQFLVKKTASSLGND